MRVVRDFCLSHIADGEVSLLFLADRAQNAEAQAARVRSGRRQFDRFEIEMTEDEARLLYAFLHRKFQGAELARTALVKERVIEHDRPAAIPCPEEDHAGIW